jgi:hypothetical protein
MAAGPWGAAAGALAGGFAASYYGRKLGDLLYDQRNANPNETEVMKQYVGSQWEQRYEKYEQALASGDSGKANAARAEYEFYLTNSLLKRGYLDQKGYETAMNYANADHDLAQNNGFRLPPQQEAAYHDSVKQQSAEAAQAAKSLVQGGTDPAHVQAQTVAKAPAPPKAQAIS